MINTFAPIWVHMIIESIDKKLSKVLLFLIIMYSLICIGDSINPAQAISKDEELSSRIYGYRNDEKSPQVVTFDLPSIDDLKNNTNTVAVKSIDELIAEANTYLRLKPASVMDKNMLPPSGDKHDFLSLAPFRWPDNSKAGGIPYTYRDGKINPEVFSIPDRANLGKMIERVKILSVAYYYTDNIVYASKASELIRVWFLNNNTNMNPNLQYAEVITGKDNGTSSGIIAASYLPDVLDSITIIHESSAWTDEDHVMVQRWFGKYLDWLLNSEFGKKESKQLNNHGTWLDVQTSSIALFLDKREIVEGILNKYINGKIAAIIQTDGSQPFETHRQTSLDYHIFNLRGLFYLAQVAERAGIDLWNYETSQGAGLQMALDYLLPYTMGEETWPHKQTKPIKMHELHILLCQGTEHYEDNERYLRSLRLLNQNVSSQINALLYGCLNGLEH
ncbi:MAG TPA: alginate lyase family protein [Nitrososphaeraceae archaeon]|nr:alginate lyase family protein [Nitrososphaeraceae archaeon]